MAVLILNADKSQGALFTRPRNSYVHLILFNAASIVLAKAGTHALARALDHVGGPLEASHVLGVTFLMSVYRITFLFLDYLYYAFTNPKDNKSYKFIDNLRDDEKAVIIIDI